MCQDFDIKMS
jgi:hypothetical protein